MTDLGTLGITLPTEKGPRSCARAINNIGEIVGDSANLAVFWKEGKIINLNSLISSDSEWNLWYAADINNKGQIVILGGYKDKKKWDGFHAFLLTPVSFSK